MKSDPYAEITHYTKSLRRMGFHRVIGKGKSNNGKTLSYYRRYHPELGEDVCIEVVFQRYVPYEHTVKFYYKGNESLNTIFFFTPYQMIVEIRAVYGILCKRSRRNGKRSYR